MLLSTRSSFLLNSAPLPPCRTPCFFLFFFLLHRSSALLPHSSVLELLLADIRAPPSQRVLSVGVCANRSLHCFWGWARSFSLDPGGSQLPGNCSRLFSVSSTLLSLLSSFSPPPQPTKPSPLLPPSLARLLDWFLRNRQARLLDTSALAFPGPPLSSHPSPRNSTFLILDSDFPPDRNSSQPASFPFSPLHLPLALRHAHTPFYPNPCKAQNRKKKERKIAQPTFHRSFGHCARSLMLHWSGP